MKYITDDEEIKRMQSVIRAARRAAKYDALGRDQDRLINALYRLDRWRGKWNKKK